MVDFTENILEIISEEKKVSFKKEVLSWIEKILKLDGEYSDTDSKGKFFKLDREQCNVKLHNYNEKMTDIENEFGYGSTNCCDFNKKNAEKHISDVVKLLKLGRPKIYKLGGSNGDCEFQETKISDTLSVKYKGHYYMNGRFDDEFVFYGSSLDSGDEFENKIYYAVWGYSTTIVDFYQPVKRSNGYLYFKKLQTKIVSGDSMQGSVVPLIGKFDGDDVFKVKESQYMRIEKHHITIWNGKPIFFNHLD